jgi:hypothetical protein
MTEDEDDSDDRPTKVKTRSKRASRAARRNKKRESPLKKQESLCSQRRTARARNLLLPVRTKEECQAADKGTENKSRKPLLLLRVDKPRETNTGPNLVSKPNNWLSYVPTGSISVIPQDFQATTQYGRIGHPGFQIRNTYMS